MTNMNDEDFERIASRKVSPLYISVHSTEPDIRSKMMRNKKAVKINEQLKFLYDNEIAFHSQIVLCPGINDGAILNKTIMDLAKLYPYAKTLSVVPVGLTDHRENLPKLKHVDEELARSVIKTIEKYRAKFKKEINDPFVYASDEFYSKANYEYPRYKVGEINAQKANGVGLFSDFLSEFEEAVKVLRIRSVEKRKVLITTGVSAYKEIKKCADKVTELVEGLEIETVKVVNRHFGESITVAGLLTGYDIIETVAKKRADVIFVPESSLRDNEDIFLDELTLRDVEKATGTRVEISPNDGYDFVEALIGGQLE
jgi:putative radical SAM enzyme (TIGR03279 family)